MHIESIFQSGQIRATCANICFLTFVFARARLCFANDDDSKESLERATFGPATKKVACAESKLCQAALKMHCTLFWTRYALVLPVLFVKQFGRKMKKFLLFCIFLLFFGIILATKARTLTLAHTHTRVAESKCK